MHIPTMVGGLPGMESLATNMMKKQMEQLDIPPVREMIEILDDSGAPTLRVPDGDGHVQAHS